MVEYLPKAISTAGYPAAMAAYDWINEVLDLEDLT